MMSRDVRVPLADGGTDDDIPPLRPGVAAGGWLAVSGQVGLKGGELPEGARAQTAQALVNLREVVESHGAELADVVKTNVFLVSMDDYAAMNEEYGAACQPPSGPLSGRGAPTAAGGAGRDRGLGPSARPLTSRSGDDPGLDATRALQITSLRRPGSSRRRPRAPTRSRRGRSAPRRELVLTSAPDVGHRVLLSCLARGRAPAAGGRARDAELAARLAESPALELVTPSAGRRRRTTSPDDRPGLGGSPGQNGEFARCPSGRTTVNSGSAATRAARHAGDDGLLRGTSSTSWRRPCTDRDPPGRPRAD